MGPLFVAVLLHRPTWSLPLRSLSPSKDLRGCRGEGMVSRGSQVEVEGFPTDRMLGKTLCWTIGVVFNWEVKYCEKSEAFVCRKRS